MYTELKKIPYIGLGVGLRDQIAEEILRHAEEIDVLEIISEKFFPNLKPQSLPFLSRFSAKFPIIPHGVKLSIGSIEPLEGSFLQGIQEQVSMLNAPYYSDHFALTREGLDLDTGHLSPLWYTKEMLEHVVRKVDAIQQRIGIPLVLENITAPFIIGDADFEEPEFLATVCERTGCGLLLDLTNIHINAFNQKKEALPLLKRYPLDAVVQIHLAGGIQHENHFHDSHSETIDGPNEGVWDLLEWTASHASIKTLIIERDDNFEGSLETMLLRDLRRARAIVEKKGNVFSADAQTLEHSHQRVSPNPPSRGVLLG